jgi:hypothetical protein
MQTIFEAAVECYENHISIVPSLNKRPTLKTWKPYQKNRAPIEQLEKWFAGDNPPNISMVLGWVSGIWGIDADNEEAVEWVENHLPCNLSETRVALTSRGRHYYFRIPPNITIKSSNLKQPLGLAIEFKGEGNMLVMPPSIRADGFQYTWLFAPPWCDIPKVDVSYFEKFLLPPPPKLPKKKKVESTEETEAPAGRKVDLTSLKTPVNFEPASAGERNDKLYRQLCKLVEPSNLKPEDIREFGHILNRQFSPPLENEECENIIKSALKYFKTGEEKEQKDSYHNLDNIKSRYLYPVDVSNTPNEPQWILEDSLLKGHIGMIFGPPGAGKGLFTASLIVSLASGFPLFDHWKPTRPFRVMAISIEDDLDILHRRLHQAQKHISEEIVSKMEYKVGSYQGKVSLTEFQKG